MLEESPRRDEPGRPLRPEEKAIVIKLIDLDGGGGLETAEVLGAMRVIDMDDGGMGGIRFLGGGENFGSSSVEASFVDEDGVEVVVALNRDPSGRLLEVDFWKVDFTPLRRYPLPDDLSALLA